MAEVTMKELLEAGVHFGHETKRWDPRMKPYIFGARNGIYIIDLQKTVQLFKETYQFVRDITSQGEYVLFVGTKKQAQESILEESTRCSMFYVNQRWLGGMLTNFQTIKRSIDRLKKLEAMKNEENLQSPSKKGDFRVREREDPFGKKPWEESRTWIDFPAPFLSWTPRKRRSPSMRPGKLGSLRLASSTPTAIRRCGLPHPWKRRRDSCYSSHLLENRGCRHRRKADIRETDATGECQRGERGE